MYDMICDLIWLYIFDAQIKQIQSGAGGWPERGKDVDNIKIYSRLVLIYCKRKWEDI